jgi:hypothetical protein
MGLRHYRPDSQRFRGTAIPSGYAAFQQISHTNAVQRFGGTLRQLLDDEQRREQTAALDS